MPLLQVNIDQRLKKAISDKAASYGVPTSSLIRIILVKTFLKKQDDNTPGNVFNAQRDNKDKGIEIDELIKML